MTTAASAVATFRATVRDNRHGSDINVNGYPDGEACVQIAFNGTLSALVHLSPDDACSLADTLRAASYAIGPTRHLQGRCPLPLIPGRKEVWHE